MQFMFVLAAFFLTFTLMLLGFPREQNSLDGESQAILLDMTSWHKAAVRVCTSAACPSGDVDATPELSVMLAPNAARLQAMFETVYDPSSKNIVTFMRPGVLSKFDGPTNQTINARIRETVPDQASSLGIFNSSTREMMPTYFNRLGYQKLVPSSISGMITNGSVVIMTKM